MSKWIIYGHVIESVVCRSKKRYNFLYNRNGMIFHDPCVEWRGPRVSRTRELKNENRLACLEQISTIAFSPINATN